MSVELDYKIGQLQYEISILGLDEEELTGVTIRTEELKDLVKKLTLNDVGISLTDKEKIDYEISQKRKDKEEHLKSWFYGMFFTFILFASIFAIIKGCS